MMRILVSEDILTLSDALENLADMEPGFCFVRCSVI